MQVSLNNSGEWRQKLKPWGEVMKGIQEKVPGSFETFINGQVKVPARFEGAHPDKMDPRVQAWIKTAERCDSAFLWGPVGTGKTYSLYALAKLYRANKVKVKVKNWTDWLEEMRAQFDKEGTRAEDSLGRQFSEDEILIIDEVGAEKPSEWNTEIMYRLINKRYELARWGTIFASNLSPEDMSTRYGDRVVSRIAEMCGGAKGVIKIDGKDRRW